MYTVRDLLLDHSGPVFIDLDDLWGMELVIAGPAMVVEGIQRRYDRYGVYTVDVVVPLVAGTVCEIVGAETLGVIVIPKNTTLELFLPHETGILYP